MGSDDDVTSEMNCSKCGYDLLGLGARGRCPECGQYFTTTTGEGIANSRTERHQRGDRLVARLRTIFLALAAVGVMGCGGLLSMIAANPARPLALAGVFAVILLLAAVTSFFYERPD